MNSQTRVLLVDTDKENLDRLETLLNLANHICFRASTHQEALTFSPAPDLIILNMSSRYDDYCALLEQLKSSPFSSATPVLISSTDCRLLQKGLALGAEDCLVAPFSHDELTLRVRNLTQRRQAWEQALRSKSAFIDTLSHELRTPLNGIAGLTTILHAEVESDKAQEHVTDLSDAAGGLIDIVNNLIDYCVMESVTADAPQTPFSLAEVIAQATGRLAERADAKSVTIRTELPTTTTFNLLGYPERIRKIFYNLVATSIRFSPVGGTVLITIHQPESVEERQTIVCSIRDNGIGIEPEEFGGIFLPAGQQTEGDGAICRRLGELGIDLYVAARVARSLGGAISIDCEPAYGNTFYLSFTARQDPDASCRLAAASPLYSRNLSPHLHILLVEDNPTNQKVASWQLSKMGHHVTIAAHGEEALELTQHTDYDLIFMDLQMPVMDGFEATRRIRAAETATGRHLPIIALTACGSEFNEARCLHAGMDDFITKPIRPADLTRIINRITAQRATGSSLQPPESP